MRKFLVELGAEIVCRGIERFFAPRTAEEEGTAPVDLERASNFADAIKRLRTQGDAEQQDPPSDIQEYHLDDLVENGTESIRRAERESASWVVVSKSGDRGGVT